jgi:hypothetical protein
MGHVGNPGSHLPRKTTENARRLCIEDEQILRILDAPAIRTALIRKKPNIHIDLGYRPKFPQPRRRLGMVLGRSVRFGTPCGG